MKSFLIAAILVAIGVLTWRHFATEVRGPVGGLAREAPSPPPVFRFPVEEDDEESFVTRAARTAREAATDAQSAAEQAGRALRSMTSTNLREAVTLAAGEAERALDAAISGVQDALRDPSESTRSAAEGALAAADHATDLVTAGTAALGGKAQHWWAEQAGAFRANIAAADLTPELKDRLLQVWDKAKDAPAAIQGVLQELRAQLAE
ncbi:hypothetical protein CG51_13065 [Haematobacter missouriensis]|uniref:Uncharacterized protein n=1 Tax=Haematobacter missouriensis TaxID=366616 RepID=A0A212ATX2_9RHOB|nr:hypothetical protein [Haematobacter missouriensis]KFI33510.1 hypothetical protein CG51_13065 [Haematobacter missouriensis]OWJ75735.1 hypothetical protein CDV53_09345 [Haematobacter missouriensis]OWJ84924.1 hypothetical protein CDV52_05515 [Haematobacter missouriensis]